MAAPRPVARALGALVLAVAALGGALYLTRPATGPVEAPTDPTTDRAPAPVDRDVRPVSTRPARYGCGFEQDQRFAFDFDSDLVTAVDGANLMGRQSAASNLNASAPESLTVRSTGRLHAVVTGVTSSGEAVVAVRVARWDFVPAEVGERTPWQHELLRPYLLRVASDCQVLDVARHREASVAAFAQVLGLLDRLQFTLPPEPDATPTWQTRQQDEYGISRWRYRWQDGPGRGVLRRERIEFESSALSGGWLDLELDGESNGTITLGDGAWFDALVETEDVAGTVDDAPAFSFVGTTRFERVDADAHGFDGWAIRVREFVWGRPDPTDVAAADAAARHGDLAGMSIGDVMARYRAIREAGAPGAWREGQELLRAWILANPDAVPEVVARIRSGLLAESESAEWALALARSGSMVAQRELEQLAADANASENVRMQATSALADLRSPDAQTIETLTQLSSRAAGASEHDFVGSTATMSLGTLMGAHPANADLMNGAQAHLQAMALNPDPVLAAEALWAMGNSGDESFVPLLETLDTHAEPRVRRGVARATRGMERGETQRILAEMLREDVHPDVVTEVVNAHREQMQRGGSVLTPYEISLYRTKLPSAPEQVRRAMIEALGVASRREPEAADVLVRWFPHETVQDLRVLIGRYVDASQL